MKEIYFTTIFLLLLLSIQSSEIIPVKDEQNIVITFGSCNKYEEHEEAKIFHTIAHQKPDTFVWLGDAAYIDYYLIPHCCLFWVQEKDLKAIDRKFNSTKFDKGYQDLLSTGTKILGIYDDHDANKNDGGKDNPMTDIMIDAFLRFLDEPKHSPRWSQRNLYGSYYIGNNKKVKMILLDARSERDEALSWEPKDNIGPQQWEWLERDLNDPNAELIILANGYLFMADDKFIIENWYWWSKRKLLNMIKQSKKRVLFISGDIHYGELSEYPCAKQEYGYPVIELTSSGLSFSEIDFPFIEWIRHIWTPDNFSTPKTRLYSNNFGKIDIHFDEKDINDSYANLQIFSFDKNKPKISRKVYFRELNHDESNIDSSFDCPIKEGEGTQRLLLNVIQRMKEGKSVAFVFSFVILAILACFFKLLIDAVKQIYQFCTDKYNKKKIVKKSKIQ